VKELVEEVKELVEEVKELVEWFGVRYDYCIVSAKC
jgi:hypothetical protein